MSARPTSPGLSSLPLGSLKGSLGGLARAVGGRAVDSVTDRASGLTQRLTDYADGTGKQGVDAATDVGDTATDVDAARGADEPAEDESSEPGGIKGVVNTVKDKAKDLFGGGGGGKGGGKRKAFKFNNFVEAIDIGAPIDVVYAAWTEYDRWPSFMKKLETAELNRDEGKVALKGQVFWSHREWQTTITHQEPEKRIVWDSTGPKGHLSGTVTFHALGEDLTRLVMVIEYHPQGFMEKTGNIWRAVNRRVRLELKLFVRYVMTQGVLTPDDFEGYQAEIVDKEMVRTHDEVMEERSQAEEEDEEQGEASEEEGEAPEEEAEYEEEYEDRGATDEPGDEAGDYDEEEYEEEEYEEEPQGAPSR